MRGGNRRKTLEVFRPGDLEWAEAYVVSGEGRRLRGVVFATLQENCNFPSSYLS